jgi:hypothetical protein
MIVSAVIESLAKNYKDWALSPGVAEFNELSPKRGSNYQNFDHVLELKRSRTNGQFAKEVSVRIVYSLERWREPPSTKNNYVANYGFNKRNFSSLVVNGITLDVKHAGEIYYQYSKLREAVKKAEDLAAKVKKDMEHNEAKWNLVEDVFGMTRDGFGALVYKPTKEVATT